MFEQLTNQLRVFINEEINKDSNKKEKVENLNDNKLFYNLITKHITDTAKGYADSQGLQYIGVSDKTVIGWINIFFENFDERIKEHQEKKEKARKAKAETTKKAKEATKSNTKDLELPTEDGLFGIEVTYKKKILTKPEFEEQMKEEYKEDYEIIWEEGKVTVKFGKKEEPKSDSEKVVETPDNIEVKEDTKNNYDEDEENDQMVETNEEEYEDEDENDEFDEEDEDDLW